MHSVKDWLQLSCSISSPSPTARDFLTHRPRSLNGCHMTNDPSIAAIAAYRGLAAFDAIDEADWPKLRAKRRFSARPTGNHTAQFAAGIARPCRGRAQPRRYGWRSQNSTYEDDDPPTIMIRAALGYLESAA